jgi:hypothetical protein
MEVIVNQHIYYSNKEWVPVKEIAESLLALDLLIHQSPDVLEALFPGTKIHTVEVFLNELKSDSIWEDIVVKFVFGSQSKFDAFIVDSRERLGMEKLVDNPKLLSTIILAMILAGGAYYLGKDSHATSEQKAAIQANNNTIIQIGAGMVDLSAEDFRAIIDSAIKDKDKLAKHAVKIVNPAKRDSTASITFNGDSKLSVGNDAVKAMPSSTKDPEDIEVVDDFANVTLEIRAIDLDSTKRGWAVVVPELHKKRVRLQLDPTVKVEDLFDKRTIQGNVTVVFGFDKENQRVPKLVFLRSIAIASEK